MKVTKEREALYKIVRQLEVARAVVIERQRLDPTNQFTMAEYGAIESSLNLVFGIIDDCGIDINEFIYELDKEETTKGKEEK